MGLSHNRHMSSPTDVAPPEQRHPLPCCPIDVLRSCLLARSAQQPAKEQEPRHARRVAAAGSLASLSRLWRAAGGHSAAGERPPGRQATGGADSAAPSVAFPLPSVGEGSLMTLRTHEGLCREGHCLTSQRAMRSRCSRTSFFQNSYCILYVL